MKKGKAKSKVPAQPRWWGDVQHRKVAVGWPHVVLAERTGFSTPEQSHIFVCTLLHCTICVCVCACVHACMCIMYTCVRMHDCVTGNVRTNVCVSTDLLYWTLCVCVHVHDVYTCMYALMYDMNNMRVHAWECVSAQTHVVIVCAFPFLLWNLPLLLLQFYKKMWYLSVPPFLESLGLVKLSFKSGIAGASGLQLCFPWIQHQCVPGSVPDEVS